MARTTKALTATQIKQAKPRGQDYKLYDGGGLYLLITKRNTKLWRMKYRYDGKEKLLSFGASPSITLSKARELRTMFKIDIVNGIDPNEVKRANKEARRAKAFKDENTLTKVANEFLENMKDSVTPKYLKKLRSYYTNHIESVLGAKPIKEIQRVEILSIIDTMQDKGIFESAKKTLNLLERLYKYAIAREYTQRNIISDFDKRLVLRKRAVRHYPTITDDKTISLLLDSMKNYQGETVTRYALKVIPYLALRPIELRSMRWEYVNFTDNIIVIPADKMKMRMEHIVPITSTVAKFLQELREYAGNGVYLFPNALYKTRYMSENTINTALRRMGFTRDEIVSHGFRSMFSTIAHEKSNFKHEVIETQLAHSIGNSVSQAYNRAKYLNERVELMQWWSDYLDELQN